MSDCSGSLNPSPQPHLTCWPAAAAEFVSEPLALAGGDPDVRALARGEPGLPSAFRWRGCEYRLAEVLEKWKTCTESSGEAYVRRHWYRVRAQTGEVLTVYAERHPAGRGRRKSCWWLYTVARPSGPSA
jgi:hypothetical protein